MAPAEMNAVIVRTPGDPQVLQTIRMTVPRPGPGEVLVRVHAAPVSSRDLSIRSGVVQVTLPLCPGSEAAGEVLVVGPGVTEWSRGDRVIFVGGSPVRTRPGAYADYLAVSGADLHSIPEDVSFLSSASVARTFSGAWSALFHDGRLTTNEPVIVIGADQPTGIAAVQICRWKGSKVIAVSNGRHARRLAALGAARVISDSAPDLVHHVAAALDGRGAGLVVNFTGTGLSDSVRMLGQKGRLVLAEGGPAQLLDVGQLVDRQAQVIGATNRIDAVEMDHILKLLGEGTFLPVIDSIYPLSKAAEGHRRAESDEAIGAILLVPDLLWRSGEEITQLREKG